MCVCHGHRGATLGTQPPGNASPMPQKVKWVMAFLATPFTFVLALATPEGLKGRLHSEE